MASLNSGNGLEEWREKSDGTLSGPALEANGIVRGQSGERRDASRYDGSDADTRLDNAISAASTGDVIYLESESYLTDRTISKRLSLVGTAREGFEGTALDAQWTFAEKSSSIANCEVLGQIVLNGLRCVVSRCALFGTSPEVDVNADDCLIVGCYNGTVDFASGTSGGLVDSCWGGTTATDNGTNKIGDLG